MKHKKLFITAVVIFSVLVFLSTFIMIWFWGDEYPDFEDFSAGVKIPGLKDKSVPQGLCNYNSFIYDEEGKSTGKKQDYFFISSYMKGDEPSRIYVTGAVSGYVGYVTLKVKDPSSPSADEEGYVDYKEHAGGIATSCKENVSTGTVWVTSEDTVYCIKGSDKYQNAAEEIIAKARENGSVKFTAQFAANCAASFCFFYDSKTSSSVNSNDKLYVGEFYRAGDERYSTRDGHHITTLSGEKQYAFCYEYSASTSTEYGLVNLSNANLASENAVPKIQAVYSLPDKIQGFARTSVSNDTSKGKIVLSQSWGLSNSNLYYFDYSKAHASGSANRKQYGELVKNTGSSGEARSAGIEYEGVKNKYGQPVYENPYVYFLDESVLERKYSVPSMSEGMCVSGSNVYVLFESACYKYKTFVRQQLKNVYYFIPRTK